MGPLAEFSDVLAGGWGSLVQAPSQLSMDNGRSDGEIHSPFDYLLCFDLLLSPAGAYELSHLDLKSGKGVFFKSFLFSNLSLILGVLFLSDFLMIKFINVQ